MRSYTQEILTWTSPSRDQPAEFDYSHVAFVIRANLFALAASSISLYKRHGRVANSSKRTTHAARIVTFHGVSNYRENESNHSSRCPLIAMFHAALILWLHVLKFCWCFAKCTSFLLTRRKSSRVLPRLWIILHGRSNHFVAWCLFTANQATFLHFVRHFLESVATCRKFGIKQVKWNERRRRQDGKAATGRKERALRKCAFCALMASVEDYDDIWRRCLDYFVLQILQISSSVIALRSFLLLHRKLKKLKRRGFKNCRNWNHCFWQFTMQAFISYSINQKLFIIFLSHCGHLEKMSSR